AYLIRDNDGAFGHVFTARLRVMGIRDRPISAGSPWQNGIAERLIGTLRRECLDHIVILVLARSIDTLKQPSPACSAFVLSEKCCPLPAICFHSRYRPPTASKKMPRHRGAGAGVRNPRGLSQTPSSYEVYLIRRAKAVVGPGDFPQTRESVTRLFIF